MKNTAKGILCLLLVLLFAVSCAPVEKPGGATTPAPTATAAPTASIVTDEPSSAPTAAPTPLREVRHTSEFDLEKFNSLSKVWYVYFETHVWSDPGPIADIPIYYEEDLLFDTQTCQFDLYQDIQCNWDTGHGFYPAYMYVCMPDIRIRRIDEVHSYAVADTDSGYRLFIPLFDLAERAKGIPHGWPLVIGEVHSSADFESIGPGSTIEEVAAVDPVAELYRRLIVDYRGITPEFFAAHAAEFENYPLTSLHYLSDGLLKLEYEITGNGQLVVKSRFISSNRELACGHIYPAQSPAVYSIDPNDLP